MADAAALFTRHFKQFCKISPTPSYMEMANIYAACIIAEAIRTEQDLIDFKIIEPQKGA